MKHMTLTKLESRLAELILARAIALGSTKGCDPQAFDANIKNLVDAYGELTAAAHHRQIRESD